MGLTTDEVQFLLCTKLWGADFAKVMMLGRQSFQMLNGAQLRSILSSFGITKSLAEAEQLLVEEKNYAEPLLRLLGAMDICSIDASAYEGATHIFDMNKPVASELKGKFSVVLDSGALEHIFNFPTAIQNCMEMVKLNGHFLGIIPCNNYLGHGFYQFSPELFFRVLSKENGFEVEKMLLFESPSFAKWYEITDPERQGRRMEIHTWRHTHLAVQARRTSIKAIFESIPQQSDYTSAWHSPGPSVTEDAAVKEYRLPLDTRIRKRIPRPFKHILFRLLELAKRRANIGSLKEIKIPGTIQH